MFSTTPGLGRLGTGAVAVLLALVAYGDASANDSPDGVWADVAETAIARPAVERQILAQRYRTLRLNRAALDEALSWAPKESDTPVGRSPALFTLPLPEGGFADFQIVESLVMAPELAARYPEIRTWLGQGIDDPTATLRFDLTPKGFHAQVISAQGTWLIDPYQPGDTDNYIAYRKRDALRQGEALRCLVTGEPLAKDGALFGQHAAPKIASGATLRTYRLAMAATGEYTIFHGGTVADGMAAIVTTLNRVNGVYERELSVRMVLVPNNDLIVYTNPATDPYANTSGDLTANQNNINAVIGSANYDIGHLVGTGGGGVAGLGVVCGPSKARGLTGSNRPVGDVFDVDYVAHEIGHQYAGNHTFNGSGSNCSGLNRNAGTAYEPGSGSSIQAYAGICGADNLQRNSDDHFHRISLNEMLTFTTTGGGSNCGNISATGNTPPSVTTAAAFTIPQLTPFELTASGSDTDGDGLTYIWDQFNLGAANAAGNLVDNGTRPIFRSFAPSLSPSRVFPSLRYILDNANSPPAQLPLPGTSSPNFFSGEILPSTNRTLNFRVTVRDNRAGGGGTNEASTALTVVTSAGPFAVTAPNTAVEWEAGSEQTVTWEVASTNAVPVDTSDVRIDLSLDGGLTWPIELAASVPNDGEAEIAVPADTPATKQARVRVSAIGNVFFDVSDANFSIVGSNTPPTVTVTGAVSTRQGSPAVTGVVATVEDTQDLDGDLIVEVVGAPPELTVSADNDEGSVSLTAAASCELVAPTTGDRIYPVTLVVSDSEDAVATASININVAANQTPTLGSYSAVSTGPGQTLNVTPSAPAADPDDNLATTSVSPTTLPGGGTLSIDIDGVVAIDTGAAPNGDYSVRAGVIDGCGASRFRDFIVTVLTNDIFKNGFEAP